MWTHNGVEHDQSDQTEWMRTCNLPASSFYLVYVEISQERLSQTHKFYTEDIKTQLRI